MPGLVRDTLRLAGHDCLIESPAEAFELFRRLYPHCWRGEASRPADLSLSVDAAGWHLRHGSRVTGPLSSALQAACALEHAVESRLISRCRDHVALHAGGVEVAGRAHLIAGPADAGKTTSTLLLVELGHRFLCEEVALIDPESLAVAPHLRTLGLDGRFLDEVARQVPLARGEVHRLGDRLARYSPHRLRREPAPLAAVYLPRLRPPGRGSRVRELDPAEALPEVLGYCFAPAAAGEAFFDRMIRLLESCRVLRVELDGVASARRLWRRLLPPSAPA